MNSAQVYMLKSAAESAISNVSDRATREALEAILKVAAIYPNEQQTASRRGF